MSNSQITIFYSWQSDLPGSETRNIIQDAIKDAVKLLRDTVDIEADRDTKGEYGSPDIAQTIFSKIDDCDIFIADVSAVCQYETTDKDGNKKVKYMPNPNVMLELGYAIHVVGWENVICVLNADYGAPEEMPFDIASRRLTPFSTKDGKSKGEIKRYIKGVIQDTVENLLENGKRVKIGFSDLRMGCFVEGTISKFLYPIEISKSVAFVKHREQIIEECLQLIEQIKSIKITDPSELLSEAEEKNTNAEKNIEETSIIRKDGSVLTPIKNPLTLNIFKLQRVVIKDDDKKSIINLCKDYLGIDISDEIEFFNIGNLERKNDLLSSYTYEGTEGIDRLNNSCKGLEPERQQLHLSLPCHSRSGNRRVCVALLVSGLDGSFNLGDGLGIRLRNNQRYAVLRCTSIDGFRLPDVGIRPTSVRTSDYLHRIVDFYILVHLIFLHKISFCIVHCRTFIALRHERRFTLRLFNIGCKQLIESGFAKTLLHGSDTKELLFIWIKPGICNCLDDCLLIGILAVRSTFDQLPTSPFLTADGLLQSIFLDVGCPGD